MSAPASSSASTARCCPRARRTAAASGRPCCPPARRTHIERACRSPRRAGMRAGGSRLPPPARRACAAALRLRRPALRRRRGVAALRRRAAPPRPASGRASTPLRRHRPRTRRLLGGLQRGHAAIAQLRSRAIGRARAPECLRPSTSRLMSAPRATSSSIAFDAIVRGRPHQRRLAPRAFARVDRRRPCRAAP